MSDYVFTRFIIEISSIYLIFSYFLGVLGASFFSIFLLKISLNYIIGKLKKSLVSRTLAFV